MAGAPLPYTIVELDGTREALHGAGRRRDEGRAAGPKSAAALLLSGRIGQRFDAPRHRRLREGTWVRLIQPPWKETRARFPGFDVGDRSTSSWSTPTSSVVSSILCATTPPYEQPWFTKGQGSQRAVKPGRKLSLRRLSAYVGLPLLRSFSPSPCSSLCLVVRSSTAMAKRRRASVCRSASGSTLRIGELDTRWAQSPGRSIGHPEYNQHNPQGRPDFADGRSLGAASLGNGCTGLMSSPRPVSRRRNLDWNSPRPLRDPLRAAARVRCRVQNWSPKGPHFSRWSRRRIFRSARVSNPRFRVRPT